MKDIHIITSHQHSGTFVLGRAEPGWRLQYAGPLPRGSAPY